MTAARSKFSPQIIRTFLFSLSLFTITAIATLTLRYNDTKSVPQGWYAKLPFLPVVAGGYAITCMPIDAVDYARAHRLELARGSCPGGASPIIKHVVAIGPGPVMQVTPTGVTIGDRLVPNSVPAKALDDGAPLPIPQPHQLFAGDIVLLGDNARSFDSRYWGVAHGAVRAIPLWIRP